MDYVIKEINYDNEIVSKLTIVDSNDKIIFSYNNDLLEQQLLEMRLEILGDVAKTDKDSIFKLKLKQAKYVALDTLYPYDLEKKELPIRIAEDWQVRCAIELYERKGTKNVGSYQENGLSVTYLKGLLSDSLMNELTPPKAGIPK